MRTIRFTASIAAALVAASVLSACGGTGTGGGDENTLTVYSADGLHDWYTAEFAKFKEQTGISVNIVEAGSGEVVSRIEKGDKADLLITLPPFIQKADERGLLAESGIDTSAVPADLKDPDGKYVALADNQLCFIVNKDANPKPITWDDLLKPEYKDKVQYSTPGQAGDGTAVLVLLQHLLGREGALDYLGKLEANNVGPSSSTGKLQPKVGNGELTVANGDIQMNLASIGNDSSNFDIFFPAATDGTRTTVSLPYVMGLSANAPQADKAKQLMEFLLSSEVQSTLVADAKATPVRSDLAGSTGDIAPLLAGVEIWHADWDAVLRDLDADVRSYQEATGS